MCDPSKWFLVFSIARSWAGPNWQMWWMIKCSYDFFGQKLHYRECITHRSIVLMQELKIRAKFRCSWKKIKEHFQYFLAPVVVQ